MPAMKRAFRDRVYRWPYWRAIAHRLRRVEDGSAALILLADEPNGLAIDFTDRSYAIRTTPLADVLLGTETGFGIDFTDFAGPSYAIRS